MAMNEIGIKLRLDGAAQVQAGAAQAAQAVQSLGNSTKTLGGTAQMTGQQTAQMSAQLQDLFVQIQAGGSPMTALLQQGSQLSAVFGGTGNALKAVASLITPTVAAVGAAAAAIGTLGYAYAAIQREQEAFRRSIVLTGNAAGVTASQLNEMARSAAVGSRGSNAETLAQLVATGQVAGTVLAKASEAAIRLQRDGGVAIKDTVSAFAELGKSPAEALKKLNESQNFLTASTYRQVLALQEQGKNAEAARVAQESYASAGISRSKELETQLGSLDRMWRTLTKSTTDAFNAIRDVGKASTVDAAIQAQVEKVNRLQLAIKNQGVANLGEFLRDTFGGQSMQQQLTAAQAVLDQLRQSAATSVKLAEAERERTIATKESIKEIDKQAESAKKATEEFKKLAEAGKDLVLGELATAGGFDPKLGDQIEKIAAAYKLGAVTADQMHQAMTRIMDAQPYLLERNKAEQVALEELDKALDAVTKSRLEQLALSERETDAAAKRVDALRKEVDALRDRLAEETGGKIAKVENQAARVADEIRTAIAEANAASMDGAPAQRVALMWEQVEALREQLGLQQSIAQAIKSTEDSKAASDAAKAWQDAAKDIRESLTDAFRRSFESGEDFGSAMAKTIGNELKARMSAALAESLADLVMGFGGYALTSLRGSSSSAVSSGASSLWDLYSTGNKAYSAYSGATTAQQFYAGYQGSSAMMGAGTVGPVTNGAAGATGSGASAASAMSTIGPYAIAAIAYAIGADQMADWSLHLGGYSEARRSGVRNIAAEIPGANPLDEATIAGMAEQGVYIPSVQKLSDGMASALFGFADQFAASVKATSPIEATRVVFESDRANPSWGQVQFLGAGNRELSSTGMLSDLNWDANVAAPQLVTRSAAAFSTAMQGSDAADWVKASLAKIPAELERITPDIAKQFQDPLQQAQAVNQALAGMLDGISTAFKQLDNLDEQLGSLGGVFGQLADMSSDARNALVQAAGGIEQFQAQTSSYVGNFYTDAEKTTLTLDAVGRTLSQVGLTLPTTRDGFRDLVDSQNLSTEAGRKAYAVLMGTADAFASVTAAGRSAADILNEHAGLERELLQLQGNTAELRAREREQLDPSNRALYDHVKALGDQQDAAEAAAKAAKTLADALGDMIDGLRSAASDALASVRNTIDAQRTTARQTYDAAVGVIDDQIEAARDAFDAEKARIDAARKQAADDFKAAAEPLQAQLDALDAYAKAQAAQYKTSSDALKAERDAAQQTYQAAADALQQTISAQQGVVQGLQSLTSSLSDTLRQMRPVGSEALDRSRGQAQIAQALALARSTGQLPTADSLRDALQAVTKPSADLFGSFEDYARDFFRTQIDIRDLNQIAGDQLGSAQSVLDVALAQRDDLQTQHEASISRLDDLLDTLEAANELARQQISDQRDLLRAALDGARDTLDRRNTQLDNELARATDTLNSVVKPLDDQKEALADRLTLDLSGLDALWAQAQAAYDAVVGNNTGALNSVADAIDKLNQALSALAGATGTTPPPGVPTMATGQWVTSGDVQTWLDPAGAVATRVAGQSGLQAVVQGTNDAVFSVADARAYIDSQIAARTPAAVAATASSAGISAAGVDALAGFTAGTTAALADSTATIAGFTAAQIQDTIKTLLSQGQLRQIYDLAVQYGISSNTVDALGGWPLGTSLAWAKAQGLPAFAAGTNFVPGDMVAQIHEGERIIPAADNAQLMAMLTNGTRRDELLVAEVRALRAELTALREANSAENRAIASSAGETARLHKRWDGDGLPDTRTAV